MIKEIKTEIFVYYPIKPVKACFKNSLYKHLLDSVWGERGHPEEDIRVMNELHLDENKPMDIVRYQFGDFYHAEEFKDEIGELIDDEFNKWVANNSPSEESLFA